MSPALVDDELWELIQPLLPRKTRRYRHPGRRRIDDRKVLNGILFVLTTGIAWLRLPRELGFGSGMTCWRRLREWQQTGVWRIRYERRADIHEAFLSLACSLICVRLLRSPPC